MLGDRNAMTDRLQIDAPRTVGSVGAVGSVGSVGSAGSVGSVGSEGSSGAARAALPPDPPDTPNTLLGTPSGIVVHPKGAKVEARVWTPPGVA